MNIRDTPVYAKHFAANEPEEHARISIQYAIDMLKELGHKWEQHNPDFTLILQSKIIGLQSHLKPTE